MIETTRTHDDWINEKSNEKKNIKRRLQMKTDCEPGRWRLEL